MNSANKLRKPLFHSAAVVLLTMIAVTATLLLRPEGGQETDSWRNLNEQTTHLYQQQEFFKAVKTGRLALETARRDYPGQEQVAVALSNLAMINLSLGNNSEAEQLEQESLELRARLFGEDDPRLSISLHHLGYIYINEFMKKGTDPMTKEGLKLDAEICFLHALAITEKARGPNHPEIIPALNKLGKFYQIIEDEEKTRKIAERLQSFQPEALAATE